MKNSPWFIELSVNKGGESDTRLCLLVSYRQRGAKVILHTTLETWRDAMPKMYKHRAKAEHTVQKILARCPQVRAGHAFQGKPQECEE